MSSSSSSSSNQFPPYETYTDCSQGICSIYCPQWCYMMFPPPPPTPRRFSSSSSSSSSDFSPLIIAVIGILATAFILITYYTIISTRRFSSSSDHRNQIGVGEYHNTTSVGGLEESVINSITVLNYRKEDGFMEGSSDCSVCLSEFEEEDKVRLLPKCNHAFHVPCIDYWLKSHATCPLCRANIYGFSPSVSVVISFPLPPEEQISLTQSIESETITSIQIQIDNSEHERVVSEMRRSSSLNFAIEKPRMMMKRSISTGRFIMCMSSTTDGAKEEE
ncbi:RING-H2 finger protein ATL51 [Linum perenne]